MRNDTSFLFAILLVACADDLCARTPQDELQLDALSAFAIGTDVNIESVREVDADSLNAALGARLRNGGDSAGSPAALALLLTGAEMTGHHQKIDAWGDPGEGPSTWFRVSVENEGYENDSSSGDRWVLWMERVADGGLKVRRGPWARQCRRIYWTYYSARPCP